MNQKKRVVVTGIGCVTPVGIGRDLFWGSLENGISGAREIAFEGFDMSRYDSRVACPVDGFDFSLFSLESRDLRYFGRATRFSLLSTKEALEDAGFELDVIDDRGCRDYCIRQVNPFDIGIVFGTSSEASDISLEYMHKIIRDKHPQKIKPTEFPQMLLSCIAGNISKKFGINGSTLTVNTACASGLDSIIVACNTILSGEQRMMIAGGADTCITPQIFGGYIATKALSRRNDAPQKASRPFDTDRDGFVLGEGSGVLILEELESALNRGARIYCEITGYGKTSDAFAMTAPHPSAVPQSEAIKRALFSANITPADVDYINAHGTSTRKGDVTESKAIKMALGDHACAVPINSTKSMIGHLLAGAGSVETIAAILMMKNGLIHKTVNLDNPDIEAGCDLSYVQQNLKKPIHTVLKTSFGFGGYNSAMVFEKYGE